MFSCRRLKIPLVCARLWPGICMEDALDLATGSKTAIGRGLGRAEVEGQEGRERQRRGRGGGVGRQGRGNEGVPGGSDKRT